MHSLSQRIRRKRGAGAAAVLAATAALVTWALPGCSDKPDTPPKPPKGPVVPTASGANVRADFLKKYKLQGKVALIEFGRINCELSQKGLEEMAWLDDKDAIKGLSYLRVEALKDKAAVDKYYKATELTFPVYHDADASVARAFDATAYPTFILVGKFGRVRYRGKQPDERLEKWVEALASEQADPGPDVPLLDKLALDGPKLLAQTSLPDLAGQVKPLERYLGPEGLVVIFADTACEYSAAALKDVPAVSRTLSGRKVNSVVINVDDAEAEVKAFYAKRPLGTPVVYDTTPQTKSRWRIQATPTVLYIDPNKRIAYNGKAVWAELGTAIEAARGLKPGTIRFTAQGTRYG